MSLSVRFMRVLRKMLQLLGYAAYLTRLLSKLLYHTPTVIYGIP